jgi:hypothetical protein
MRRLFSFALVLLVTMMSVGAAEPAALPASKPEVRKEIVATIDAQLAAFRSHEVEKAYRFAAAALRAQKPLPVFVAIVQTNYPEIWNNTRAECGIVHDNGEIATVLVHVFAKDSDASYDYQLVKEDGRWRVHGVLRHEPIKEEKV